ncbi:Calmodulin-binding transcription activator 2 [Linum perenne]
MPGGSLFLFDRKVLRYFRKDGHNWRKKKDGKTVKEAHEKLKVGSVDVLHCYYAHGEDTESFQRRSYWMLEQELMHIVFVHYLEVKGNRTHNSPSNSLVNHNRSGNTDSVSPSSTLSSTFEDADSADSHQTTAAHSFHGPSQLQNSVMINKVDVGPSSSQLSHSGAVSGPGGPIAYGHGSGFGINDSSSNIIMSQGLTSWEDVYEQSTRGFDNTPLHATLNSPHLCDYGVGGNLMQNVPGSGSATQVQSTWQIPSGDSSSIFLPGIDPALDVDLAYDFGTRLFDQRTQDFGTPNTLEPYFTGSLQQHDQLLHNNLHTELLSAELHNATGSNPTIEGTMEGNGRFSLFAKKPLLGEEGLKKVDSFSRWVSKELGEVDDLNMKSSSGIAWSNVECGNVADESVLSPSLSQDQLFSIMDFSPKWAYAESETEVHIVGMFLKSQEEVEKCDWSCMFGEVEVRAKVLADGILCCFAPPHGVARVPLYVTCSNRVACSEVREFDYLVNSVGDINIRDVYGGNTTEMWLHLRLEKLLSLKTSLETSHILDVAGAKQKLVRKIMLLKEEDDNHQLTEPTPEGSLSNVEVKRKLLRKLIKEKLYAWLLHKVLESGKGPCVLDDDGQGILHLAAALGWDWAIKPTVAAGVSINFRDVNGWTALHWAAYCGREQTVAVLVSWRAAPGALTDPSPEFPSGRTAAELASGNGHKGISGFLAESFLTSYLSTLTVKEQKEDGATDVHGRNVVQTIEERTATPLNGNDVPDALSLKDSLTAIRNATQAANRIYQVFRMQSFQRKQLSEHETDEFGLSDERALSLLAGNSRRPLYSHGTAHAAATQIQKKFRGWKKRREFLIIRQRIVKIQAHIRGHQVRKQYKTVVWSVGILEKIILRWRRKGSGLRGFRRDAMVEDSTPQNVLPKEDDYDYLKEGRKQNEERVEKTLNRVKSMFHDPNGRAQYRRLLTVVEGLRENQACSSILNNPQDQTAEGDDEESSQYYDFESLLDDDTFMSIAFDN